MSAFSSSSSYGPSPRDRTQEFASLTQMFQSQMSSSSAAASSSSASSSTSQLLPRAATVPQSQFAEAAKGINAGITSVATKLQDLTKLTKGTSLFNDQSSAIAELTSICKQDMMLLNDEVEALERWVEGGDSSSSSSSKSHSQHVVFNLKTQLGNQARAFAHVLTLRTKHMKEQSSRRKQFTSGQALPLRKRPLLTYDADLGGSGELPDPSSEAATAGQPAQVQYQVMLEDQGGEQYVANRAAAVQDIESTIQELATMYQRLAILVKQQEEQAVRLDMTVEETLEHTVSAHEQLTKFYEWVQGNRWLMLKVFAALIAFAVIFVVFVQ